MRKVLAAIFFALPFSAFAQVQANPVVQRLPVAAQGASITLENISQDTVAYDTTVTDFHGVPQSGFIVTPRIATIEPGKKQVLRIYRQGRGTGFYRVVARQLPGKKPGMLMSLSMPLMFEDTKAAIGPVVLESGRIVNRGTRAAKVQMGKDITTLAPGESIAAQGAAVFFDDKNHAIAIR